jgi:1,4-dihydroxy-2-naphthoyl-CoA hydrolase
MRLLLVSSSTLRVRIHECAPGHIGDNPFMTTSIFKRPVNIDKINSIHAQSVVSLLGIEFLEVGPDFLCARMPVDARTTQPMGILHGGSSIVLAETLGSVAAIFASEPGFAAVGLEINANHLRAVTSGWVTGKCTAVHIGRTTQVWSIEIRDEAQKLVCIARITMAIVVDQRSEAGKTLSKLD